MAVEVELETRERAGMPWEMAPEELVFVAVRESTLEQSVAVEMGMEPAREEKSAEREFRACEVLREMGGPEMMSGCCQPKGAQSPERLRGFKLSQMAEPQMADLYYYGEMRHVCVGEGSAVGGNFAVREGKDQGFGRITPSSRARVYGRWSRDNGSSSSWIMEFVDELSRRVLPNATFSLSQWFLNVSFEAQKIHIRASIEIALERKSSPLDTTILNLDPANFSSGPRVYVENLESGYFEPLKTRNKNESYSSKKLRMSNFDSGVQILQRTIRGTGMNLELVTVLVIPETLLGSSIAVVESVPESVFIDPYELYTLKSYFFIFESNVDVEAPATSSNYNTFIIVMPEISTTKVELVIPVHCRYQMPSMTTEFTYIRILPPFIYSTQESIHYEVQAKKCEAKWIRHFYDVKPDATLQIKVPVGNSKHVVWIFPLTLVITSVLTLVLGTFINSTVTKKSKIL